MTDASCLLELSTLTGITNFNQTDDAVIFVKSQETQTIDDFQNTQSEPTGTEWLLDFVRVRLLCQSKDLYYC